MGNILVSIFLGGNDPCWVICVHALIRVCIHMPIYGCTDHITRSQGGHSHDVISNQGIVVFVVAIALYSRLTATL